MRARELRDWFFERAPWIDHDTTVDGIIIGDPEKTVRRILVTWIASFAAVREAVARGVDLLITHEPTFWAHGHEDDHMHDSDLARTKRDYIEDHGLVILRNHDVWDKFPEIGIPWAWARFLQLGGQPVAVDESGFQHRYDIAPVALDELARRVARATATIGEPQVQVIGDGRQPVSRIGVGTGCGCDLFVFRQLGCDASIVCDDGTIYWWTIQHAEDDDHPVVRVNHGTSEEPGMVTLTDYLNENLPQLHAEHLPHGPTFRLIGGQ